MIDIQNCSLNELYEAVLASSMQAVNDNGSITRSSYPGEVTTDVAMINDRELVMPTAARLKDPRDTEIFFHPLSEQVTRGQSSVFKHIRHKATLRLVTTTVNIGYVLLKLQERPELQRQMNVEQQDFIKNLIDTDKSSADNWLNMTMNSIRQDPARTDKWLINIFMKNNGSYDGKNYRRVAVTSFPAFEHVADGKKFMKGEGADEKMVGRAKDYLMFKQMADTLFPGFEKPGNEQYNAGYDGVTAPYTVAFFRAYAAIAERLNSILDLFKTPFENAELSSVEINRIPLDWKEMFCTKEGIEELAKLARRVPALKGNIGELNGHEDIDDEPVKKEEPPARQVAPTVNKVAEALSTTALTQPAKKEVVSKLSNEGMTPEQIRVRDEAIARQKQYQQDEAEWAREKEERDARYNDDRNRGRDRYQDDDRPRDRYRDEDRSRDRYRDDDRRRDEPIRNEKPEVNANGKISFNAVRDAIGSPDDDDDRGRRRGRGRDDDYDVRDRYRDDVRDRGRYRDDDRDRGGRYRDDDRDRGGRYRDDDRDRGGRYRDEGRSVRRYRDDDRGSDRRRYR